MKIMVQKKLALQLYCLARQGERSIDFGLQSLPMWSEMREFFDGRRRSRLELAERTVLRLLPEGNLPLSTRDEIPDRTAHLFPIYVGRLALNRFRSRWRFPVREVAFLARTFKSLVSVLQSPEKPDTNALVNLRLDLAACQWIIAGRLMGVSTLRRTQRIEHFGQSAHVASLKWEDIFPGETNTVFDANAAPSHLRKTA